MLFFLLPQFGSSSQFWHGAPLFLNVTVILALACLIVAGIYFGYSYQKTKKRLQRAQIGNSSVANQNKDFDPKDDKDPNRPLAIIRIKTDTEDGIAGPIELFEQLPHVTFEVMNTIKAHDNVINLFNEK